MNIAPYAAAGFLLAQQATAYALPTDITESQDNTPGGNSIEALTFNVPFQLKNVDNTMRNAMLECYISSGLFGTASPLSKQQIQQATDNNLPAVAPTDPADIQEGNPPLKKYISLFVRIDDGDDSELPVKLDCFINSISSDSTFSAQGLSFPHY